MAASTTLRVPKTLVRAASMGWCSRTGTCLWAAAWKTTSGRNCSKTAMTAERSLMSTRACSQGVVTVAAVSWRWVSSWSRRTSRSGSSSATWRRDLRADGAAGPGDQHPPPGQRAAHGVEVDGHRGPAQEVLDLGLASLAERGHVGCPVDQVAHHRAAPSWSARPSRRHAGPAAPTPEVGWGWPGAPAGACTGPAASGMSSMDPTTGTPSMDSPWARASSSNTATGTRPAPGLRSISLMAAAPASRLPTTATRSPTRREPRCQANSLEWKRRTPMPGCGEHAADHDDRHRDQLDVGASDRGGRPR